MLKKLNNVLSNKEKLYLLFVFFGAFIASSIDVIGIGSIVLYITFLSNPNEIISKIQLITKGQLSMVDTATQANAALSAGFSQEQIERLKGFKQNRNIDNVNNVLKDLKDASTQNNNLMPYIINAVKSSATLGEISDILRSSFGVHS